jgi:hypothetical protein
MTSASQTAVSCSPTGDLRRLPHLALSRYLSESGVLTLARTLGWRGRRRVFDPWVTLWALVAQALGANASQECCVTLLAAALGRDLSPGSGALCRAGQRLVPGLAQAAAQQVARLAQRLAPRPAGPRTWLLDGSYLKLADTEANQQCYPQSTTQRKGCGYPQLHLVALVDLATGCLAYLAVGNLHDHDAKLGRALWDCLRPGDTLLCDRGFASWGLLVAMQRRGVFVVCRQHQRRGNAAPLAGAQDDRWETWAQPKDCPEWWDEDLPAACQVRVVRQRLSAKQVLVLNTNLPVEQADTAAVLALYAERWRVETRFLEFKVLLGAEQLRARDPQTVDNLLWSWVLAYNLVCCVLTEAATAAGEDRYRFSFQAALDTLAAAPLLATTDPEVAGDWVRAQLTRNCLARRGNPHRDEPRRLKQWHRAYAYLQKPRAEYHEHGRRRLA